MKSAIARRSEETAKWTAMAVHWPISRYVRARHRLRWPSPRRRVGRPKRSLNELGAAAEVSSKLNLCANAMFVTGWVSFGELAINRVLRQGRQLGNSVVSYQSKSRHAGHEARRRFLTQTV
jgi:hypothetical protein